jgi:hypothetical protein
LIINFTKEYNQSTFTAADTEFRKQFSAKTPYFIPDVSWRKAQTEARTAWGAAVGGIVIREKVAQIGPGYDDENVANRKRTYRDRENGTFYEKNWKAALVANVNIIIVETWNEFHEGSDIAESKEYGRQYINITKQNADIWKKTASISKIPASKAVFIDHLYSCVLNRKGEKKGTEHWNKQTASTTLATMYGGFFNSKEYVAKKVAVEIFVTQLYVCTLFREPSNTEVQNWVTELAEITRPQAVERFVQSKEFTTKAGLLLNKNTGFQLLKR